MCIGQNSKIESSLIETAPIKRWVLSVEVVLWRHGHLVSPGGRPPYRAPPCYGAVAREPIWLVLQLCTIDGVTLLHWWCCTIRWWCWRIFEIAQSAIKCVFNVANLPWTIQSQHDQSFMFEFEIQEGDYYVCISQTTCKSSPWEFVSFSEQNRLSRSDSTWGDKTEGSTLFSREGSRRACR